MDIKHLIVSAFVVIVLIGGASILGQLFRGGRARTYPFVRIDALFSPAERSFLGVLSQLAKDHYVVLGKIRLADIIKPKSGLSQQQRQSALNRIISKHVDFALCDPRTLSVIGVIELDDKSHKRDIGRDRDAFIDAALAAAGVPVLHVPAQRAYTPSDIQSKIAETFEFRPARLGSTQET